MSMLRAGNRKRDTGSQGETAPQIQIRDENEIEIWDEMSQVATKVEKNNLWPVGQTANPDPFPY